MGSLVGSRSCFIMTAIGRESSCQKVDLQNQCKQTDEGGISNMTKVQNPYKLPLNLESIVFIKKPEESASYQYRFEDNR